MYDCPVSTLYINSNYKIIVQNVTKSQQMRLVSLSPGRYATQKQKGDLKFIVTAI